MYVDSKLIRARAANPENLVIKHRSSPLKNPNKPSLNHEERVMIGSLAKVIGAREVERTFDISQAAASNFAMGITRVAEGVDKELQKDVEAVTKKATDVISDRALNTLTSALGIVDDRLSDPKRSEGIKTVDIAKIAKDMSTIHTNMKGKDMSSGLNFGMQIVIHAPVQKSVRDFEVVND